MTDPFTTSPKPPSTPAGWFPDPLGRHEHRWYNGTDWTADVSDGGVRQVDPLGSTPSSASTGQESNGLATAALVCGIISIGIAWIPFIAVVGLVLAVLAIIFGIRGVRRSRTVGKGGGPAIAGIVTGSVGILLSVVGLVFSVFVFQAVMDFVEPGPLTAEIDSCTLTDDALVIEARLTNDSTTERDYTVFATLKSPRDADNTDAITELFDVEPGQVVEFQVRRSWLGEPGPCEARLIVQGPFPFGIEVDRTNSVLDGQIAMVGR